MNQKVIFKKDHFTQYQCDKCSEILFYDSEFDSIYCQFCDVWKNDLCNDDKCLYCILRPQKPSECKADLQ